jgi:hypothetical protein
LFPAFDEHEPSSYVAMVDEPVPRNQIRLLRLPSHQASLNLTWRRPQFSQRTRQCQAWLPSRTRMTSRMEKKFAAKFAYVVHRDICGSYMQRHVCRWMFSLFSHHHLHIYISTTFTPRGDAATKHSVEPIEDVDVYPLFCEPSHSPKFYSADSDSTPTARLG